MNACPPKPMLDDSTANVPHHDVQDLMAGGKLAYIQNDGVMYTLRITRAGKLILTK